MERQLDVITLAVDDLERSLVSYHEGLGVPPPGVIATEFTARASSLNYPSMIGP
jgi:hypothetical protein